MVSKNTKTLLVKTFVRNRSNNKFASFLAADTTLLCSGMIYTKQRETKIRNLGERIITSVLKSHNVGQRRTSNFISSIKDAKFNEVKKLVLKLQPYKEMKRWVEEIN